MLKKLLSILLAVILAIGVLSACATDADSATDTTADTAASADTSVDSTTTTTETEEPVVLKLGIYPADTDEAAIEAMEDVIARYNEEYPNVEVERDYYKYSTDNIAPMAEAGTLPTIFETWFTEPQKLIRSGYVRDITDILEERGWLDQITPAIRTLLSDEDGKVYGIPRDAYALGLMCNVELFEEAGLVNDDGTIQYPTTWEELAQVGVKIKEATGSAGFVLLAGEDLGADGWHFSNIAWAYGATLVTDNGDGTYTPNLNSQEVVDAMEMVKSLKWTYDILTADPFSEGWASGFTQIGTGAAAMYIGANDAVEQPTANNGLAVDKLALVPMPAGPGGQYSLSGGTPYMFAADATDEEVNAALDFLVAFGKAPVVDESTMESLRAQAATKLENGVPNIQRFPCWTSTEIQAAEAAVLAEYTNVNANLYADYFAAVSTAGNLHTEEPGDTQAMYKELGKVIQEVIMNEDSDVQALLDTAQSNYIAILDEEGILGK